MTKFVCDFEEVNNTAEKLNNLANEMNNTLTQLSSNIESETSNWDGKAKSNFIASNNTHIELIKEKITYINALSNFIKESANKIESTDASLASLNI